MDFFIKINGKKKTYFYQDQYFPDSAETLVCHPPRTCVHIKYHITRHKIGCFYKNKWKKKKAYFNQDQYFPDAAETWVCNSNILKCFISCGYNHKFQSTNEWINIYPSNHQQANTTVKVGCHWKVLNTSLCSFNYLSHLYI